MTIRVDRKTKVRLEKLAKAIDRTKSYVAAEAIRAYIDLNEWQITEIKAALAGRPITSLPHEQIIAKVDEVGKTFHILILKTTMTVPYTSVFLQLNCKYWSDDAEAQLRKAMSAGAK